MGMWRLLCLYLLARKSPSCAVQYDRQDHSQLYFLRYTWSKQEEECWNALHGLEGICFSPDGGVSLPRTLFWTEIFHWFCKAVLEGRGIILTFPWGSSFSLVYHRMYFCEAQVSVLVRSKNQKSHLSGGTASSNWVPWQCSSLLRMGNSSGFRHLCRAFLNICFWRQPNVLLCTFPQGNLYAWQIHHGIYH